MVAEWEAKLVPGERLPGKVKKSQKIIMNEVLSLLAFALHMKMDAKLPSHDGNKVKSICKQRYITMGRELQIGNFTDYSLQDTGHYAYDSDACNIIVKTMGDPSARPTLTLSPPTDYLQNITDFVIVDNYSLQDARLKSAAADLDVPLSSLFKKQLPDLFVEEVDELPESVLEQEELAMNRASDDEHSFTTPIKPIGTGAASPVQAGAQGRGPPLGVALPLPLGNGDAGEVAIPQ